MEENNVHDEKASKTLLGLPLTIMMIQTLLLKISE